MRGYDGREQRHRHRNDARHDPVDRGQSTQQRPRRGQVARCRAAGDFPVDRRGQTKIQNLEDGLRRGEKSDQPEAFQAEVSDIKRNDGQADERRPNGGAEPRDEVTADQLSASPSFGTLAALYAWYRCTQCALSQSIAAPARRSGFGAPNHETMKTGARRVSAIIPTFQRREQVLLAIGSALRQTGPLEEIIVIDDGSSDGTWEALQALAAITRAPRIVLHRQRNAGPSAARNAGARLASGEFVAFLDSDDTWHAEKTARQLALFDADPELALAGCVPQDMNVFPDRRIVPISIDRLLFRNYFLTPGVMVRREVLGAAGGFAEDMRRCEDYELWLRIASRHRCVLLNEVLMICGDGKRSFGESGLSADIWAMQAGELEAFRRWRRHGGSNAKYLYALALCWLRFVRRAALSRFNAR
jgi:glycosyltransferase involved in cell wall biosynthesis